MSEETLKPIDYFSPLTILSWILSFPIRVVTYFVEKTKIHDPERVVCPGCGFRGDSGTGKKSCVILFVKTASPDRAAIQHTCLRCSCVFFDKLFIPADKWMAK